METINNVASAAAKAVWGDNEANREPVSGVQGNTAQGEPYDAGNADATTQHKIEERVDNANVSGTSPSVGTGSGIGAGGVGSSAGTDIGTGTGIGNSASINLDQSRGDSLTGTSTKTDTTAGQNDTRDPRQASTGVSKNQDVDTNTPGPTSEGNNLSGAGPRPLDTVAKEHGGDAGNDKPAGTADKASDTQAGEEAGEKGTGEEYVKSSGLQADGGDFDVTKPGAGREADRLMEQKGIHRDEETGADHGHGADQDHDHGHGHDKDKDKDKPSIGERIKAKLHKH